MGISETASLGAGSFLIMGSVYNTFFKQMEAFRELEATVKATEAFVLFRKKENAVY